MSLKLTPAANAPAAASSQHLNIPVERMTIIYHSPCPDGHTAAAAILAALPPETRDALLRYATDDSIPKDKWNRLGLPPVDHCKEHGFPIFYGTHPKFAPPSDSLDGRAVIIVDVGYDEDKMHNIASRAEMVVVMDHHSTSEWLVAAKQKQLDGDADFAWLGCVHPNIRMDLCGSELAWDAVNFAGLASSRPPFLDYIAASDLWLWEKRRENARAVHQALMTDAVTDSVTDLLEALHWPESKLNELGKEGELYLKVQSACVKNTCSHRRRVTFRIGKAPPYVEGGFGTDKTVLNVLLVNTDQYISQVGNTLCGLAWSEDDDSKPDCAAVFVVSPEGTSVSLRAAANSTLRLGHIAKNLRGTTGGGGHDHAAGFSFVGTDIKAYFLPVE